MKIKYNQKSSKVYIFLIFLVLDIIEKEIENHFSEVIIK